MYLYFNNAKQQGRFCAISCNIFEKPTKQFGIYVSPDGFRRRGFVLFYLKNGKNQINFLFLITNQYAAKSPPPTTATEPITIPATAPAERPLSSSGSLGSLGSLGSTGFKDSDVLSIGLVLSLGLVVSLGLVLSLGLVVSLGLVLSLGRVVSLVLVLVLSVGTSLSSQIA